MSADRIESAFLRKRAEGRKLLVPFITGGVSDDWVDAVRAAAAAGADAIEIGIPFSDPVMDGPVIQAASVLALQRGATPMSVLAELSAAGGRPRPKPFSWPEKSSRLNQSPEL